MCYNNSEILTLSKFDFIYFKGQFTEMNFESLKVKAVPLHAMESLGGRGGSPTCP
jgi:hypothetical protein